MHRQADTDGGAEFGVIAHSDTESPLEHGHRFIEYGACRGDDYGKASGKFSDGTAHVIRIVVAGEQCQGMHRLSGPELSEDGLAHEKAAVFAGVITKQTGHGEGGCPACDR